nr:immunoglobulin heavy chain junction region [Mus musculus]
CARTLTGTGDYW